jgi:hypothetical protein
MRFPDSDHATSSAILPKLQADRVAEAVRQSEMGRENRPAGYSAGVSPP